MDLLINWDNGLPLVPDVLRESSLFVNCFLSTFLILPGFFSLIWMVSYVVFYSMFSISSSCFPSLWSLIAPNQCSCFFATAFKRIKYVCPYICIYFLVDKSWSTRAYFLLEWYLVSSFTDVDVLLLDNALKAGCGDEWLWKRHGHTGAGQWRPLEIIKRLDIL